MRRHFEFIFYIPCYKSDKIMAKKLNKIATGNRIIEKCKSSKTMSIDVDGFWKKIKTVADFKEACEFCRVEPVCE